MFKYNEDKYLKEIKDYIESTYTKHYSKDGIQCFDVLVHLGYAVSFVMGSILKYCWRFGQKDGLNRTDLLKLVHYTILRLWLLDKEAAEYE